MPKHNYNEHYIQNQIRLWCGEHDLLAFRCNVGKIMSADGTYFDTGLPSGFPDLLILDKNGKTIFCECKSEKGKQREDQKKFQEMVESRNFVYLLPHSLEEFIVMYKEKVVK